MDQTEIGGAWLIGCIKNATVRVDLEHVDRPISSHAIIAARVTIAIHGFEKTHGLIAQHFFNAWLIHWRNRHLFVFDPLHVVMLERFAFGEHEFNRLERDGVIEAIRIFCNEAGELAPFDELFKERAAKLFDLASGLDFELLQAHLAREHLLSLHKPSFPGGKDQRN